MNCPNWHPVRGNGHCNSTGLLQAKGQPVPCPSCWATVGRPPLNHTATTVLRRYHVLLIEVAGLGTDQPDRLTDACRNFDHACADLTRHGVTPDVRDAWVAWVESHAGAEALGRLRDLVIGPTFEGAA